MRKNLSNVRKKSGFTQDELAKKLNISTRQYQRLETGTSNGSMNIWLELKKILESETMDFLLEQEVDIQKKTYVQSY